MEPMSIDTKKRAIELVDAVYRFPLGILEDFIRNKDLAGRADRALVVWDNFEAAVKDLADASDIEVPWSTK